MKIQKVSATYKVDFKHKESFLSISLTLHVSHLEIKDVVADFYLYRMLFVLNLESERFGENDSVIKLIEKVRYI